jgi:phage terminase Nu1 subunit (DNA packaging protein)
MRTMTKVTTAEIAAEAGVSVQTARELARRGIFVRVGHGRFDREASMAGYLARLRGEKSGKRGGGKVFESLAGAPNERSRLAAAQADAQELKNKIALGKLIDASAVETEWSTIVTLTRDAVLAAPSRIAAELPHLTAFDISVVDKHLREAMARLGSGGAP